MQAIRVVVAISAIVITSTYTFAQGKFREGYIVTLTRDTVVGLVHYREGAKSFESCSFKKTDDSPVTDYKPGQISGYGFVGDKVFQYRDILIDGDSKPFFLEVLAGGSVNLYKYDKTLFVEKGNNGLHKLSNDVQFKEIGESYVVKPTNQHIAILNMLLFDCSEMQGTINSVKLGERQITKLVEKYNRCKDNAAVSYKSDKPWLTAYVGILGGMNLSRIRFEESVADEYMKGRFEVSNSFIGGLNFGIRFPRLTEKIAIHSEVLYSKSTYHSYSFLPNGNNYFKRNYVTIDLQQIKIPLGIRYTFPGRRVAPYVNAGMSATFHLDTDSQWIHEKEINHVVQPTTRVALQQIDSYQLGFWGGLGLNMPIVDKFTGFIEFRFEQTNGILHEITRFEGHTASRIHNIQLTIGLRTK